MVRIDPERAQIAVVQADEPGIGGQNGVELTLVVDFDQRLEAELAGQAGEPSQLLGRQDAGQEQDDVGTRRPQNGQLAFVDDELLGQDRHRHRLADGGEVGHRTAEPVRLAQDGDGARAAGLVCAGEGDRIRVGRDRPCRGRSALDLGDQMQAGRRQPLRHGPRGTARLGGEGGREFGQGAVAPPV